jgi:hypothetical protein
LYNCAHAHLVGAGGESRRDFEPDCGIFLLEGLDMVDLPRPGKINGPSGNGIARRINRGPGSSSKIVFRLLTRRLCSPLKSRSVILINGPVRDTRELYMSQVRRDMGRLEGLHFQAIEVALQAKALKECSFPGHSDWVLDQGDNEATRLAYAIGTNRWENGEIDGEREEFLDAIKHVIKGAPYECPRCDRMMAKD